MGKPISLRTAYGHDGKEYDDDNPCMMDTPEGEIIHSELQAIGGIRAIWDPYCHEYKSSTIDEKRAMVEKLKGFFNCDFESLVEQWKEDVKSRGPEYLYRLDGLEHAIRLLECV